MGKLGKALKSLLQYPYPSQKHRLTILAIPYILGLLWFLAHPLISVSTGEAKCRGRFVDEHSFMIFNSYARRFDGRVNYTSPEYGYGYDNDSGSNLCSELSVMSHTKIQCRHQDEHGLYLASIVPKNTHTIAANEGVVIVIDSLDGDKRDPMMQLLLAIFLQFSDDQPWLSKVVTFVSPSKNDTSLEDTVGKVLDMYTSGSLSLYTPISVIRQAFVLDISYSVSPEEDYHEYYFHTQGRRGLLPNMDLPAAVLTSFDQTKTSRTRMHKYERLMNFAGGLADQLELAKSHRRYVLDFAGMLGFMTTMAVGPYAPHASFLDHGIDAITIEKNITWKETPYNKDVSIHEQFISFGVNLMNAIRVLSNLNERLHHSVFLYVMPSANLFVSNGEYIFPCLLALLPLVFQSLSLILREIKQYKIRSTLLLLVASFISPVSLQYILTMFVDDSHIGYNMAYIGAAMLIYVIHLSYIMDTNSLKSLQCAVCIMAIYLHVPLMLAHFSLAFPSILFWSLKLTLPNFNSERGSNLQSVFRIMALFFLFVSYPPFGLVPNVFPEYTLYILSVFTPLHLLAIYLWSMRSLEAVQ